MPLARSRIRMRREALAHVHGSLNLIPLVDILTAIVFFSLLSFLGLRSALASFELGQSSTARDDGTVAPVVASSSSIIVVRVDRDRFVVRHPAGEAAIPRFSGADDAALASLHRTLAELTHGVRESTTITVVPSDDVLYDDLVRVLDEVHRVSPAAIALGSRARR